MSIDTVLPADRAAGRRAGTAASRPDAGPQARRKRGAIMARLFNRNRRPAARLSPETTGDPEALARYESDRAGPWQTLFNIFLCVGIALVGGIGSAYLAIDRGRLFNAVELGQWTAYPDAGTPDSDPYSAATLARTGQVPLGAGEGLAFFGDTDTLGDPLSSNCTYVVSGETPPARLWTLALVDAQGRLVANDAGRQAVDSRHVLRGPDGTFRIAVAHNARPGNWLPVGDAGEFTLVLRLYDTPLTTGSGLAQLEMPTIVREDCE